MSFATKVSVGLLSLGVLIIGALPSNARPATLITDTNLLTDPSLTATVSRVLSPGSKVEVLNITVANDGDYWYYVRSQVQGRAEGWVRGDLTSFEPSQKRYATLAGDRILPNHSEECSRLCLLSLSDLRIPSHKGRGVCQAALSNRSPSLD